MRIFTTWFLLSTVILSFFSCEDEDNSLAIKKHKERLLAGENRKVWKISQISSGLDFTRQILHECEQDNLYILYRNNTGVIKSNQQKCEETEQDVLAIGNWQFLENYTRLELSLGQFKENYSIIKLEEKLLKVSGVNEKGLVYTITFEPVLVN